MKSDDNTAKSPPITDEEAAELEQAIASRPASPPRGYMVQGEVRELEPEGWAELEVAWEGEVDGDYYRVVGHDDSYGGLAWAIECATIPEDPNSPFETSWEPVSYGDKSDAPECALVAARIAENLKIKNASRIWDLEEWNSDLRDRVRELEEDGRHQQARIRELEEWKRSRVDLEGELESEREACAIAVRKWSELETRLDRIRPAVKFSVRVADFLIPGTAGQGARLGDLARDLDALTPADREWAEGDS